jgi:hypothetical protein
LFEKFLFLPGGVLLFFDEQKRKKLTDIYRTLPETERAAYRVLALVFIPIAATNLKTVLNTIEGRAKWTVPKCASMLEQWMKLGLVGAIGRGQYQLWYCSKLMTEIGTRELIERRQYDRFEDAVEKALNLSSKMYTNFFSSVSRYLRAARTAFYKGDVDAYAKVLVSAVGDDIDCRDRSVESNPFVQILANPLEMERLSSLPPEMGAHAFFFPAHAVFGRPRDVFRYFRRV